MHISVEQTDQPTFTLDNEQIACKIPNVVHSSDEQSKADELPLLGTSGSLQKPGFVGQPFHCLMEPATPSLS